MLKDILSSQKTEILAKWRNQIYQTYPQDSQQFLRGEKDQFNNPVGFNIKTETETILNGLTEDVDLADLKESIDKIIKIRSVQDFSPAHAVGIFYLLKNIIRESVAGSLNDSSLVTELLQFESRIDRVLFIAFDIYMQCQQKIFQIRVDEIKNKSAMLFKRTQEIDLDTSIKNNPNNGIV
jgi:RsbT co-antagonist protein rsbRD N-terminal domain